MQLLIVLYYTTQIQSLASAGLYEEAINICSICNNEDILKGVNVPNLYEMNAFSMLNKGDFEKAVMNFVAAKTDFVLVASNFPDFIPSTLQVAFNINNVRQVL